MYDNDFINKEFNIIMLFYFSISIFECIVFLNISTVFQSTFLYDYNQL